MIQIKKLHTVFINLIIHKLQLYKLVRMTYW